MINFYNVTKIYPNGVKGLNDVSLTIQKGEQNITDKDIVQRGTAHPGSGSFLWEKYLPA